MHKAASFNTPIVLSTTFSRKTRAFPRRLRAMAPTTSGISARSAPSGIRNVSSPSKNASTTPPSSRIAYAVGSLLRMPDTMRSVSASNETPKTGGCCMILIRLCRISESYKFRILSPGCLVIKLHTSFSRKLIVFTCLTVMLNVISAPVGRPPPYSGCSSAKSTSYCNASITIRNPSCAMKSSNTSGHPSMNISIKWIGPDRVSR